jgi:hypothetical protein
MTREEAEAQADKQNLEHPDRGEHRWLARERDGAWEVAKVTFPAGLRIAPLKPTVEARPKPPQAPDPRPAYFRDAGGPWVA